VNCIGCSVERLGAKRRRYGSKALRRESSVHYGEAELQELFSKAGTVESVRVMRDAAPARARVRVVEMATDEEAQKAATEFHQYQMGGRSLT